MRSEQAVFDDLANLCASPGFIHAIAWFCVRDNLIAYKGDLKPDDLRHLYTKSRIIRSEMVTLQGLLARVEIDFSPPEPKVHKAYCDKAEALLSELHDTLLAPWRADFQKAIGQVPALEIGDRTSLDFSGASLREPIFYGGESAYSFQYRDFAPLKYLADKEWLLANRGFDMDAARLKAQQIDKVDPALVIDVFALDAIAEMLETPLRFLSYLRLRGRFGHKLHVSHEMTLLSDHIKRNLWVEAEYDFVTLDDDLSIDLEVALLVRREGLPGKRTPEGVLTRFAESSVGRLLKALEANPQPGTVELGLFLLELNEKSMSGLSLGIDKLVRDTRSTGRAHAASLAFDEARTGLTLRCLPRWTTDAHDVLRAQSIMRKYERKASTWYGLIFDPNGDLRAALKLDEPWVHDENVERALATMPNQEPWATEKVFSSLTQGIKIGRNEPCPCGSGRKYKKCCLGR